MSDVSTEPETSAPTFPALSRVTAALSGREDRPAQQRMAVAVDRAISTHRHLIVAAGTGTGKSLAYLVPALAAGTRCVVATATKALQDQLAGRDLPLVADALGTPVTFAVLKGRSNYVCRQRIAELSGTGDQLALEGDAPVGLGPLGREIKRLAAWAEGPGTGDRAELDFEPSAEAWAQVSVGPRDCPGASRCPSGDVCFAEAARQKAANADVVVVNTHLYATHLASGGGVLPPHDLLIIDEAHELEDVASSSLGFDLAAGRVHALARTARPLLDDAAPVEAAADAASSLNDVLAPRRGTRLGRPTDPEVVARLTALRERVNALVGAVRKAGSGESATERSARRLRVLQAGTTLVTEIDQAVALDDTKVAWVEGPEHAPVLRGAKMAAGSVSRMIS